jgi:hypothetical protein
MTVIERTGGIRVFLVERYLPIYPIYLTLWVVAVALTLLAATILWRIRVEEAVPVRSPGYREFTSTRRRFVPGVW